MMSLVFGLLAMQILSGCVHAPAKADKTAHAVVESGGPGMPGQITAQQPVVVKEGEVKF